MCLEQLLAIRVCFHLMWNVLPSLVKCLSNPAVLKYQSVWMVHFYCKWEEFTYSEDNVTPPHPSSLKWQKHTWPEAEQQIGVCPGWSQNLLQNVCLQAKAAPWLVGAETGSRIRPLPCPFLCYRHMAVTFLTHLWYMTHIRIGGFKKSTHGTPFLLLGKNDVY